MRFLVDDLNLAYSKLGHALSLAHNKGMLPSFAHGLKNAREHNSRRKHTHAHCCFIYPLLANVARASRPVTRPLSPSALATKKPAPSEEKEEDTEVHLFTHYLFTNIFVWRELSHNTPFGPFESFFFSTRRTRMPQKQRQV